jgi:hypothetical protein
MPAPGLGFLYWYSWVSYHTATRLSALLSEGGLNDADPEPIRIWVRYAGGEGTRSELPIRYKTDEVNQVRDMRNPLATTGVVPTRAGRPDLIGTGAV